MPAPPRYSIPGSDSALLEMWDRQIALNQLFGRRLQLMRVTRLAQERRAERQRRIEEAKTQYRPPKAERNPVVRMPLAEARRQAVENREPLVSTQAAVAFRLGRSQGWLAKIEAGARPLTMAEAWELCWVYSYALPKANPLGPRLQTERFETLMRSLVSEPTSTELAQYEDAVISARRQREKLGITGDTVLKRRRRKDKRGARRPRVSPPTGKS